MSTPNDSPRKESATVQLARVPAIIRHAFESFLGLPTMVVGAFFLLAWVAYALDRNQPGWLSGPRQFLHGHLFADSDSTSQVLAAIAGGMITLTSITFSLLLVALQQSAGSMTHAVFDQFMRRGLNQIYAGWFIGVTLYALITLATVAPDFNPIVGATIALVLTSSALYVLLLLIYSAIEQMRPESILESIHDLALAARERQLPLLRRTRRAARRPTVAPYIARAQSDGFVTAIDLDVLAAALNAVPHAEVVLCLPIGGHAAYADPIAEISSLAAENTRALADAVVQAVRLERERNLDQDAAFAVEQIETIAWTAISTSKQDPAPGREAVRNLRDLLARWVEASDQDNDGAGDEREREPLAVVYPDDVLEQLMASLESLTVVASESMQHQVYAEILRGLAVSLDRLPPSLARQTEELVLRSLAGLGDYMLTAELDRSLIGIIDALQHAGLPEGAAAVQLARDQMRASVGHLNSRATRVPTA